jgi:hypothetical protein
MNIKIDFHKKMKYFDDDTDPRNIYNITITYKDKTIGYKFGDSIYNTKNGYRPSKYDILCSLKTESRCPLTFDEFCDDYGYNNDSIKAHETFERCSQFSKKIHDIFTSEDINNLPD